MLPFFFSSDAGKMPHGSITIRQCATPHAMLVCGVFFSL